MPYDLKALAGEPIIIGTLNRHFNLETDFPSYHNDVYTLLNAQPGPVYYVLDVTEFLPDFTTLITAAHEAARGQHSTFNHPNVYQVIFVTTAPLMQMVAAGMDSDVYGNIHIITYPTLAEALAYARH